VKEIKTGFQPRINLCRDKEGNILVDRAAIFNRSAEYFSSLLKMEDGSEQSVAESRKYKWRRYPRTNTRIGRKRQ
jgi:hypothetical protein